MAVQGIWKTSPPTAMDAAQKKLYDLTAGRKIKVQMLHVYNGHTADITITIGRYADTTYTAKTVPYKVTVGETVVLGPEDLGEGIDIDTDVWADVSATSASIIAQIGGMEY